MKKLVLAFFTLFLIIGLNIQGASASENGVYVVNGESSYFSKDGINQNGTTLVPLRGIFETLGATVLWNQKDKTITAKKNGKTIWLKVGSKSAKVNGNKVAVTVAPIVKDGKVFVPLRFVSEALNATVGWNQETATVTIVGANSSSKTPSNWLGDYYNRGYSGTGVLTDLVVNKKTPTTIQFTSETGYRYDPTNGYLAGYQMPWKFFYVDGEAKLTSDTTAKYNSKGCTFDMTLVDNSIYITNMSSACGFTNIEETVDDEYTMYTK